MTSHVLFAAAAAAYLLLGVCVERGDLAARLAPRQAQLGARAAAELVVRPAARQVRRVALAR
jgi:hypothetical protein